jgi:hypothetical protein
MYVIGECVGVVLQLETLIHCCCRRKKFLQGMTKMNGPVMLLALRDNVAAMEVRFFFLFFFFFFPSSE